MKPAPLVDEDVLLAAGQISVHPNPFQNRENVIVEAEERMQTMLDRIALLAPTGQLAADHRLARGGIQRDRGIRQLFPERYPGDERGYATSDDCDAGHWQVLADELYSINRKRSENPPRMFQCSRREACCRSAPAHT